MTRPGVRAVVLSALTVVLAPLAAMAADDRWATHTGQPGPGSAGPGSSEAVVRAAVRVAREMEVGLMVDLRRVGHDLGIPAVPDLVRHVRASGRLWAWQVGDPDPWADGADDGPVCAVRSEHQRPCTVPVWAHDGPHAASDGQQMVEVWW
ncbi:MAG: hypothetical protein FWH11_01460 [Micrococcales bacterium]|nr:hypothetical protein [Micrococcales bacterium]